jgi:poly-gamma-glutamate capsule biosynthesis protein CapA/YwtB (metallophosphatase superfamily)
MPAKIVILSTLVCLALITPATAAPSNPERITVAAVGDIMMGSDYQSPQLPPLSGKLLLRYAAPFFLNADIAMANLEGPLLVGGTPAKAAADRKSYLFRSPPAFAETLRESGLNMLSLANNHAYDFGMKGIVSTRKALSEAGISSAGKYGAISEFNVRGITVGVIGFSFGPPPRSILHPRESLAEIELAARNYDILILSIHGGAEGKGATHVPEGDEFFMAEPRGDLIRFAHNAVDRGADLVVMHGPHVPRGMEIYQERLIAYSLGNFCTYGGISVSGISGYAPLLQVDLDRNGSFQGGRIESFLQKPYGGPRPDALKRSMQLIRKLSLADFPVSAPLITDDGAIAPVLAACTSGRFAVACNENTSWGTIKDTGGVD